MRCDADPDQFSAIQPHDDVGVEQVETDSWNNERVHGGNVWRVVAQKGANARFHAEERLRFRYQGSGHGPFGQTCRFRP